MSEQDPSTTPSTNKPRVVDIPEHVTLEIRRLHLELVAKAKQFEAARIAFGEYMRSAKKILNVPNDAYFDISDDATKFTEVINAPSRV